MKRKKRNLLTLSHLQVLITVAKYNSFSQAALQLEMSQAAVSNAVATLESGLGVVLFSRGRHGAYLTSIGERILVYAQQMLQIQEEILNAANLARGLEVGHIRIASFRSVTTHILSRVIAQFHQCFPDISLSLVEHLNNASVKEDLRRGRADIGFTDELASDEFETWKMLEDEYVVLLPPSSKQPNAHLSWEQLSAYPLIMAAEGDMNDEEVYAHCSAHNTTLQVAYRVSADSSIVSMVAQGLGGAIIPRLAAEPIPAVVQVCSLPVPLFRTIWVAILANAPLLPPVFAFLDMLRSSIKQTDA